MLHVALASFSSFLARLRSVTFICCSLSLMVLQWRATYSNDRTVRFIVRNFNMIASVQVVWHCLTKVADWKVFSLFYSVSLLVSVTVLRLRVACRSGLGFCTRLDSLTHCADLRGEHWLLDFSPSLQTFKVMKLWFEVLQSYLNCLWDMFDKLSSINSAGCRWLFCSTVGWMTVLSSTRHTHM